MAFTLLADIVGVDVLSLPFAVAQLGWLLGAAVMLVLGLVNVYARAR